MTYDRFIDYSPEVRAAIEEGKPLVALESTIISHGMPYPENVRTASALEEIIRLRGAVPATMAVIKGRIKAGLSPDELEYLATADGIEKASRRDMGTIVAGGKDAATTVAATMICARMAGIKFFATGGIGGVHRGAEKTFDISADLQELARTSVAVISAGVKSILDLPLTMEYLETMGVPVYGYRTEELPAFYSTESGLKVNARMDSPGQTAAALKAKWEMGIEGGAIIANPIPAEHSVPADEINAAIDRALADAEEKGISGKAVTPFLLDRIKTITGGRSLAANIELVKNNAALAADIAAAYAKL